MMKSLLTGGFLGRKKTNRSFKEYHTDWFDTLKNTLLPLLDNAIAIQSHPRLSPHVDALLQHFHSYYDALDLAASDDVSQLLFPEYRNSLEKPFLWLGDFHPYLFTNLLRSFLDDHDDDDDEDESKLVDIYSNKKPWKIHSKTLMVRVDRIECGLRLLVPALVNRVKVLQSEFIDRVGMDWGRECTSKKAVVMIGEEVTCHVDELVSVFMDANRLRRSVLVDIVSVTNEYQGALYLQALSQILVGFRDSDLLNQFQRCKVQHL